MPVLLQVSIRVNAAITLLELFQLQPSVDIVPKTGTVALTTNVEVIQCQIKIIRESQSSLKKSYFLCKSLSSKPIQNRT